MVLGLVAPRGVAENELKLSLSMGRKIIEIPLGKFKILVVLGALAPRGTAENELKLSISMGRKSIEIPLENEGFWGS